MGGAWIYPEIGKQPAKPPGPGLTITTGKGAIRLPSLSAEIYLGK
jgi:hypothetical protein